MVLGGLLLAGGRKGKSRAPRPISCASRMVVLPGWLFWHHVYRKDGRYQKI